ncbi:MAG: c-type cytochrome, partial [Candidatus Brocadiales bacterium]
MGNKGKKEEEKSYVGWFVLLSLILGVTNVGALWNEIVGTRPWKDYQSRFYELEYEKSKKNYEDAVSAFEQPDVQKEYEAIQEKLNEAEVNFKKPGVQVLYRKTLDELRVLEKEELSPLRFEAIITRNKMLEEEYLYGKYKKEELNEKAEDVVLRIANMDQKNKKLAEKIKSIESRRAYLQERLDGFKSEITEYTKQLKTYTSDIDKYKEITDSLMSRRPQLQVYQVRLEELNEVDRCMSCHVGINKSEKDSVSEEQPYAGHPRREVYLGNHPPERFGCVLCHEGQARATTSPEKAHGEVEYWLKPIHRGKIAQSSCIGCHDKNVELVGGEEIWKGIKLFQELGCYGCHETEGFGVDKYRVIGPDLNEISSKVNAAWLVDWLMRPKNFRPTTRMPDFILEERDAKAIAAYLWQQSEGFTPGEREEFDEETIDEGAYIFESVGCLACHSDVEEEGRTHGPNLARVGEKMNYEFLVSWLL